MIGTMRMVKVGWAVDPVQRMASFQTGSPVRLCLYYTMTVGTKAEARGLETLAHLVLDAKRAHGEWFKVSPQEAIAAVVQCIQGVAAGTYHKPAKPMIRVVVDNGAGVALATAMLGQRASTS